MEIEDVVISCRNLLSVATSVISLFGMCSMATAKETATKGCLEHIVSKPVEVAFLKNTSRLQPNGKYSLDKVIACAMAHPELKVILTGYTDSKLGAEYALAIGQNNADSALRYLKAHSIPESQLTAVSMGRTDHLRSGVRVTFSIGPNS